jgi:hypothetical protein
VADLDPATQQLIAAASQVLSGDQLSAFMAVADAKRFAGDDGTIDAEKVSGHLRTLFHVDEQPPRQSQQSQRNWGQSTGQPAGQQAGDAGRDALKKRHGVGKATDQPAPGDQISRGQNARAELKRRHGV